MNTSKWLWLLAAVTLQACSLQQSTAKSVPTPPLPTLAEAATAANPTSPAALQPSVPTSAASLPRAPAAGVFPGLYFTDDILAQGNQTSATLLGALPCSRVIEELSSGEWQVTSSGQFTGADGKSNAYLAEIRQGSTTALVWAREGGACSVRVEKAGAPQILTAAGFEKAVGPAREIQLACLYMKEVVLVELGYEGPGDFRLLLVFAAQDQKTDSPVDLSSNDVMEIAVAHSSQPLVDLLIQDRQKNPVLPPFDISEFFTVGMIMMGNTNNGATPAPPTGAFKLLTPGDSFTAAEEISSASPLEGKISLSGLDGLGDAPESIQASFHCNPRLLPHPQP